MLADAHRLRYAILSHSEVFSGEPLDWLTLFVFDNDGLDNQLHLDGEREVIRCVGRLILADLLRAGGSSGEGDNEECWKYAHG